MAEYHAGTDIEIPNAVPTSGFRNAIKNPKRYMKHNAITLEDVSESAYKGDYDKLEELLSTGDESNLFNGDLNAHSNGVTALHMAAMMGQTECVELLLKAKADPHVRESMAYGQDPEDGKTALAYAKDYSWDDCMEILEQAEKDSPYGFYTPYGSTANAKQYKCHEFGKKPAKGFFSSRPGAAETCGFDAMKYGTGPLPEEEDDEPEIVVAAPKAALMPSEPPIPVGLLFPGQGSQYVKMLENVKDVGGVKDLLSKAKGILGWDALDVCLKGPASKLEKTDVCHPVMFIAGLAALEKLKEEAPEAAGRPGAVAGLGVGEYAALVAAGVMSFEDGLKIMKVRSEAMAEASTNGGAQALLSVAGLKRDKLEGFCKQVRDEMGSGTVCHVANALFPKGATCGGSKAAMEKLEKLVKANGALQAKLVTGSGAFHTPLMQPAAAKVEAALREASVRMKPPKCDVYMNCSGTPVYAGSSPHSIIPLLVRQLTEPVLWEASVKAMITAGISEFYEVGPMKQLKAMMKRIDGTMFEKTTNVEV
mmetsp:Transcript_23043/g.62812  ORF Transcript_23043/g.62812 Transcript_23043/m.62812 type:complete len:535 (-) Transcript_23043:191-1795(-)